MTPEEATELVDTLIDAVGSLLPTDAVRPPLGERITKILHVRRRIIDALTREETHAL